MTLQISELLTLSHYDFKCLCCLDFWWIEVSARYTIARRGGTHITQSFRNFFGLFVRFVDRHFHQLPPDSLHRQDSNSQSPNSEVNAFLFLCSLGSPNPVQISFKPTQKLRSCDTVTILHENKRFFKKKKKR